MVLILARIDHFISIAAREPQLHNPAAYGSLSVSLVTPNKALHSELELECLSWNSSQNEFFAIFEVRF
jgi:hypothetical protein